MSSLISRQRRDATFEHDPVLVLTLTVYIILPQVITCRDLHIRRNERCLLRWGLRTQVAPRKGNCSPESPRVYPDQKRARRGESPSFCEI